MVVARVGSGGGRSGSPPCGVRGRGCEYLVDLAFSSPEQTYDTGRHRILEYSSKRRSDMT